jgi:hypothetical protein
MVLLNMSWLVRVLKIFNMVETCREGHADVMHWLA